MKHVPVRVLAAACAAVFATPSAQAIGPAHGADPASAASASRHLPFRAGELIVKYRATANAPAIAAMTASHGMKTGERMFDGRFERLKLPSTMDVPGAVAMLSADPLVEYAEPNFLRRRHQAVPNDPQFAAQWGLRNTGQANFFPDGPAGIPGGDLNAVNAWDADGNAVADRAGRGNVIIAVIDDAFETTHPDLAGNMVAGFDFVDNDSNPAPTSNSEAHGTAVAGAAAAVGNNGVGVAGAAWNERIMPLRFGFDVATQLRAFDFARVNGARIVNASYGGPGYAQSEVDAIAMLGNAGILFVASSGNQDSNLDFSGATYPANYRLPNVLAVAATNRQDGIASFSTYGPVTVPLAAPGLQIITTTLNGGYTTPNGISGTSFSAPYVSGIAALIRDYLPTATVREVKARLINAGQRGVDGSNPANLRTASGRLDANRALSLLPGPALVISPARTSSYTLRFSSGTVDIPVYDPVVVDDGGNRRLDPGETATIRVAIENLWQTASNVRASLSATGGVIVNSGTTSFGSIADGAVQSGSFSVSVPSTLSGYQQIAFTLAITADGGYATSRSFLLDVGRLSEGQTLTQSFQPGLYDEFHTWVIDVASLPFANTRLRLQSTGSSDVDFFVRYGEPAQYSIDLDAATEVSEGDDASFYYINVPESQQGNVSLNGNETVSLGGARTGSYYVTVVNYDRTPGATYTLRASLEDDGSGGDSGGGAASPTMLMALFIGLLARLRRSGKLARIVTRDGGLPGSPKA